MPIKRYELPPKEKTFIPLCIDAKVKPWKERTWYRAMISCRPTNPVFPALIFSGFLHDGQPAGCSAWTPEKYINGEVKQSIQALHYVELVEELFTVD